MAASEKRPFSDFQAQAENLLHKGKVTRAFTVLTQAWEIGEFSRASEIIGFASECVQLAVVYGRKEPGEEWLRLAEHRLRSLASAAALDRHEFSLSYLRHTLTVRWDVTVTRKLLNNDQVAAELERRYRTGIEHWLYRQHLAFLLRDGQFNAFDDLLKCRVQFVERPTSFDNAVLLHLLVQRYVREARYEKSLVVAESALRKFRLEERAAASLLRCGMLCRIARAIGKWPDFDRAHRLAREADSTARRLGNDAFLIEANHCRATLYRRQGRHREALSVLLRPENFPDNHTSDSIFARVNAAWFAVQCQRLAIAEKLLAEAREAIDRFGYRNYQSFFYTVKCDLYRTRGDLERASTALELAKAARHDEKDARLELLLTLSEAWLAHELEDVSRAMECAVECVELARGHAAFVVEAQGLLLQSSVLLKGKLDEELQDKLYERVLPRLGAIGDPELLMKVLANLYLYTWESNRDIELSDLHLKQLAQLRPRIGTERFEELYQEHVTGPVFGRMQRRMFGS